MKLKEGWILTELSGAYAAVPTGESAKDFFGIVRLNETGRDIWEALANGLSEFEIVKKIMDVYSDVDEERAQKAVRNVIDKLLAEGLLEE